MQFPFIPLSIGAALGGGAALLSRKKKSSSSPLENISAESAQRTLDTQRAVSPFYERAVSETAPFRSSILSTFEPRLGATNFDEFYPGAFKEARESIRGRLASSGPDVSELKRRMLEDFDIGFERSTAAPLRERLIQQGLSSSGPGYEITRRIGEESARNRALLGSQFDLTADELARQRAMDALGLGETEFGYQRRLGFEEPLTAFQAAGVRPDIPTVGGVVPAEEEANPLYGLLGQVAGAGLGAYLGGPPGAAIGDQLGAKAGAALAPQPETFRYPLRYSALPPSLTSVSLRRPRRTGF